MLLVPGDAHHRRTRRGSAGCSSGQPAPFASNEISADAQFPLGLADRPCRPTCSGTNRAGTRSTPVSSSSSVTPRARPAADRPDCGRRARHVAGDFATAADAIAEAEAVTEATGARIARTAPCCSPPSGDERPRLRLCSSHDRDTPPPAARESGPVRTVDSRDPPTRARPV